MIKTHLFAILFSGDFMELIIVRHGDPNYVLDSLTKKGKKEAKLLSDMLIKENADYYYSSPLGRAKKTGMYTMKRLNKSFTVLPWLREFQVKNKKTGMVSNCWDKLPSVWTQDSLLYTDTWYESSLFEDLSVKEEYFSVCAGLDKLLESHGYIHKGKIFEVKKPSHEKIILFCHFGVECVILSHLFGISPMPLWHNFVALPTSVTRIVTEEREEGIAAFRLRCFGDTSHLYFAGEEPSFAARFCECYSDDTRH